MKKRIVSALLVCVLGMSLVTGCGNNAKAAETTKTADGKIQLDLWYSGGKTAVNVFQDIVDATRFFSERFLDLSVSRSAMSGAFFPAIPACSFS